MRQVSRPVFSFRPTLEDPAHKRAWEILKNVPGRQKNAFLVQAILQLEDREKLEASIRQIIREELQEVSLFPKEQKGEADDVIPDQMLDFLSGMEEDGGF